MEKEFVTIDLALRMKQLGFDESCFGRYYYKESYPMLNPNSGETELVFQFGQYVKQTEVTILAPLYQQAFDFFEEKYFLSGEIQKQAPYQKVTKPYWWYMIQDVNGDDLSDWQSRFGAILDKAHQNIEGNFVDDDKFAKFLYDDNFAFETRTEAKLECLKKLIEIKK
jgi:hypothetical protein